jgi:phosphonopyruvate decarboxylase
MLCPKIFYQFLKKKKINFFSGVPDSLLKNFIGILSNYEKENKHIIASNEGAAVAIAAGHYMATKEMPLVYLQNSGLGNIVNPILSLADKKVYSIPMIIIVGWRGEPFIKDEPQHIAQGQATISLIKSLKKKYIILSGDIKKDLIKINQIISLAKKNSEPVFILIKKDIFNKTIIKKGDRDRRLISREEAINIIVNNLNDNFRIVATTGMISRELYEIRNLRKENHSKDFLTVGSMGYASQIGLGVAISKLKKNIKVVCLDGDGSFLMHMGGVATIGSVKPRNFIHIVLNNGSHDSVGGQPTAGFKINISGIAKSCSYDYCIGNIKDKPSIIKSLNLLKSNKGTGFLEILVKNGSRKNLGRPKEKPITNKKIFMKSI